MFVTFGAYDAGQVDCVFMNDFAMRCIWKFAWNFIASKVNLYILQYFIRSGYY